MQILEILNPVKNSQVFGTVEVIVRLTECSGIVNDWQISVSGNPGCSAAFDSTAFDFSYSIFGQEEPCETTVCGYRVCAIQKTDCLAIILWDTTKSEDGPAELVVQAGEAEASITVEVLNHQPSYRILNKKLINSEVTYLDPYTIEMEISSDVAELIESLPLGIHVDMEAGAHERFTQPANSTIIGEDLVERVLDLKDALIKKTGDTIHITVLEETAKYFSDEFANARPTVQIGQIGTPEILERQIETIEPRVFPATHTEVFENE